MIAAKEFKVWLLGSALYISGVATPDLALISRAYYWLVLLFAMGLLVSLILVVERD